MLSRSARPAAMAGLLLLVLSGCDGSDTFGPPFQLSDLDLSPRPDAEAEWAAVWYSGELAAPDSLYRRIHTDLAVIRDTLGHSYPAVDSLTFGPPWIPGVMMEFQPATREEIRRGEYHDWDALNRRFRLTEVDTVSHFPGSAAWTLHFERRLHPAVVAARYLELRGVAWTAYTPLYGWFPALFPGRVEGARTYLFRNCGDACASREYWYFHVTSRGAEFIGYWNGEGERPDWWDEIQ